MKTTVYCRPILAFCWQVKVSVVHSRHMESNTNTIVESLNVTLLLDMDSNHLILAHLISVSIMENGISQCGG